MISGMECVSCVDGGDGGVSGFHFERLAFGSAFRVYGSLSINKLSPSRIRDDVESGCKDREICGWGAQLQWPVGSLTREICRDDALPEMQKSLGLVSDREY